ncbi:alpha-L-rhamnosidase [Sphingobacterium mizutaii]|uniref:alpha-L-rhamnosidase n=1 Tax=Sphingobacterium mizutaii TaxID=1010 RepID=UPI00162415CE|nr:alpha-L-rhamnosidase [Sphingobacterium mizutaii]
MGTLRIVCCICLGLLLNLAASYASIQPKYLRTEYKINPYVEESKPRLSWELEGKGFNQSQLAYQVMVASSEPLLRKNQADLWDSKKVNSNQTNQIEYAGKLLQSGQRVYWKVRSWDEKDRVGKWSEIQYWELAKPNPEDWKAKWIGVDLNHLAPKGEYHLPPSPYLRKEVSLKKKIKSARLYISSLGLHNFYVNGEKIGRDYFASGWTDYNKRVYYNVYDVTDQLSDGNNVFGAILSSGWYAGYLGYALLVGSPQVNQFYGKFPLLKAQIDVTYEDGSKEHIATDSSWKYSTGAIQESDFLEGEKHDARKEPQGWNRVGFDASAWTDIQEFPDQEGQEFEIYPSNPVRVLQELSAKSIKKIADGQYIVDFGQNFAGNIRLKINGSKGDSLVFRYGEMLFPDGKLMTDNLRKARATDTYILNGSKNEEWSPSFTFHGFQFVEVTGLKVEPSLDFLTGLVMSSDLDQVGSFESDNPMLNQLYSNILWTQKANYLDIPTDCPQRDERLGWTGDAQVYMRSAIFNADVAPFHKKWIKDLNDSQWPNGAYPIYAPMPVNAEGVAAIRASDSFSPGWSEAGIICTYEYFKAYNDLRIVRESLPFMRKFMAFLKSRTKGHVLQEGAFEDVNPKGGFGDWLSVGEKTSPDLLATTYYFYCNKLMAEMCRAIGDMQLAADYEKESFAVKMGFKQHYMDEHGKLKTNSAFYGKGEGYVEGQNGFSGHTQTAYANALYSGILDEQDEALAGKYLRELLEANGNKLSTGFLGFKPLLPALTASGSTDKAYMLLQSTEYPSLGYEVVNGATSIWERWDSYSKEKGFVHNAAMNSFSHYAFGSVNEWMFEHLLGIKLKENGFQEVYIQPEIGDFGINEVAGSYRSIAGNIKSAWSRSEKEVIQEIQIPVNVVAYCSVNTEDLKDVKINGEPIDRNNLVRSLKKLDGKILVELGSGKYTIRTAL